ncbi:MAG: hypothetical protein ACYTDY_02605, partial [Planctomycetota bacterium]
MHLISIFDLEAATIRDLVAGKAEKRGDGAGLVAVLDFLPLGVERLALRKAAALAGAEVVEARDLFPGFPARTDLLDAARAAGAYADAVVVR